VWPNTGAPILAPAENQVRSRPELEAPSPRGELPVNYLLRIMRSGKVDAKRRDWAAKTALRFTADADQDAGTQRAKAGKIGKKEEVNEEAKTAGHGTGWAGDLDFDAGRPN
jgi:hypothetical protein